MCIIIVFGNVERSDDNTGSLGSDYGNFAAKLILFIFFSFAHTLRMRFMKAIDFLFVITFLRQYFFK